MVAKPYELSRARVERAIASVRVALASASLFAVWMDPAQPARNVGTTYTLHAIFVAYAIALALVMWRRSSTAAGPLPLATHAVDIGV